MTVRRWLVAIVILGAALPGASCRPSGQPPEARDGGGANEPIHKLTVRFVDLVNVDVRNVPLLMAFDELAKQGYDVETTHVIGATIPAELLVRGDADVAMFNNQTAWTAVAKGADIRTIAQYTGSTSVLAARDRIRGCGDLHHRPFGASSSTGTSPTLFAMYLERHCPGTTPDTVVIPQADARAAALVADRVDAAMMPVEQLIRLQQRSSVPLHALMSYAREFPSVQIDGLHVRRAWAIEHPQAVKDLLRAQLTAHRQVRANPQLLFDESRRRLNIDAAVARAVGESHLLMDVWDVNGGLTVERVQSTLDFLIAAGTLPEWITAGRVADLSYLDAVLAEIGKLPDETAQGEGQSSR